MRPIVADVARSVVCLSGSEKNQIRLQFSEIADNTVLIVFYSHCTECIAYRLIGLR